MRREWGPWIKSRQWHEFERLAKSDPSQPLADTVAELERGFPDKADRRALRKVLYLLAQAGYRPDAIVEREVEREATSAPNSVFGFIVGADMSGSEMLLYGMEQGRRVRWLIVDTVPGQGISNASELDDEGENAQYRMDVVLKEDFGARIYAPVSGEYVLFRIAEEVRRTPGRLPSTIAYWRSHLAEATSRPHPAECLPRAEGLSNALEIYKRFDVLCLWRLELGFASQLIQEYEALVQESPAVTTMTFGEYLLQVSPKLLPASVLEGRITSLLDLGYICHWHKSPASAEILALADDLRAHGAQSAYAHETLSLTVLALRKHFKLADPEV